MTANGRSNGNGELYLRDVIDIPKTVLAGSFKVALSEGFGAAAKQVGEYVVTPQLEKAFRRALSVVRESVASGKPNGAYLHGSFGSGKSHFMTVLHAILSYDESARGKRDLQPLIADNREWMQGRKFLMVPYHLVGSTDLDSAILGGYVNYIRRVRPDAPVPPVFRLDSMLEDARRQRAFFGDDEQFIRWLGNPKLPEPAKPAPTPDEGDLPDLDLKEAPGTWNSQLLNQAFEAGPGDQSRDWLASALLSGPYSSYSQGALGAKDAYLPLENGLEIISQHAKDLGYDALILFLDELILWLQTHLAPSERVFVNDEINKLVKLVESGVGERALPIVSFVSRQRDLAQLIGADAVGADAKNLETQLKYLAERVDTISLEDRNLPAIVRERVLKPVDNAAETALMAAFDSLETTDQDVRDVLLDANGATHADWADFKKLYPLSPALLNVLVALSGALQRERTGLRLIQEMLSHRREDMKVGQLIPLGDLWDVLSGNVNEAFTDRLRSEAETADRFHKKVQAKLLEKYGSEDHDKFRGDDRFIKTLLLAYLAPEVPALTRLTAPRLAALNYGSIRSRTGQTDRLAITRMRELEAMFPGVLRSDGPSADPVFSLHLSDLDVEPLLDAVGERDTLGARKRWVRDWLWRELGLTDSGAMITEREIVWHGTRRTAEFVFENVRDPRDVQDGHFKPSAEGRIRFVISYPFDDGDYGPRAAENRVIGLQRDGFKAPTIVWLASFLSGERGNQLGRLLKINFLLERDHLREFATHLSSEDQVRVRHQLEAQRETLTYNLGRALPLAYGIHKPNDTDLSQRVTEDMNIRSLYPGHKPQLQGGGSFEYNLFKLADGLLDRMYPKHPNFDVREQRKPVSTAQFKKVYVWIARAMDEGSRRVVVNSGDLDDVRRVVHALELGEVHDGPLIVGTDWRRLIDRQAAQNNATGDYRVEDIREWIEQIGWTGLDKTVSNLLIATYALLADRSWVLNGTPEKMPELDKIGSGWALRAQELPDEGEFSRAHTRASAVFGVSSVPDVLYARNVHALAEGVRAKAAEWNTAVNGLRHGLSKRRAELGVTDETPTKREQAVRDAEDLLARVRRDHGPTQLVRDLAAATYPTNEVTLGITMSSADKVLDQLERTEWELLASIRTYTERGDSLADRSERLLREVATAAADDEYGTELAPVLRGARSRALELINEAARIGTVTPSTPQAPTQPEPPRPAAEEVPRADTRPGGETGPAPGPTPAPGPGHTPTSAKPAPGSPRTRRVSAASGSVLEDALSHVLSGVQDDIRAYAEEHPGAEILITWEPRAAHNAAEAPQDGDPS
ncbi:PglY protein [Streptomyces solisilvae]|uniref:PglY protein n=1 Tax=Streptomyces malaysiensis TaxID=92644 RepID=UPI003692103B